MVALERQPPYQLVATPAEGERQDNYPDKGSSVPGCSPSGASPSGACRLELVSCPPPLHLQHRYKFLTALCLLSVRRPGDKQKVCA